LIAVFNDRTLQRKARNLDKIYQEVFNIFEIQAIAASIQNILLKSFAKDVGSLWIGLPLLFRKQISEILCETNAELMAFIVLGYPKATNKSGNRISVKEKCRYAK